MTSFSLTRREFVLTAAATAAFGLRAADAWKPILRIRAGDAARFLINGISCFVR